jgi:peptidoglycan hydrolase-like amidase
MKKTIPVLLVVLSVFGMALSRASISHAIDPIDQLEQEKNDLQHLLQLSVDATKPLESQVNDIERRIAKAQADVKAAQAQTQQLSKSIDAQEVELATQYQTFTQRVASRYKRRYFNSPLLMFLNSSDATHLTQVLAYRQSVENRDNTLIHQTGEQIKSLEEQKKNLEKTQARLAALQQDLDKQGDFFQSEINKAKAYQKDLTGQIASLTAKQQEILNARSGSIITSVGDVPQADDPNAGPNSNPGFNNAYGVFTFGAYTHRKGMSQYGAKGRAQAGQSYKEILKAYYGQEPVSKDTGGSINVTGQGSMDFETKYLYGIAEMPASFPKEALKAQAIAARTYAYRSKQSGQAICATEACQVFNKGKSDNPPAGWKEAVDETRGEIIDGVVTYFSSTTGGYGSPVGWDTKCGNKGCWTGDAYEKLANSPWFYRGWYRSSYSSSSPSCGRSNPWLREEEMADIINAWLVRKNSNGADVNRIVPVTINQCNVGGGGNPYSMEELKNFANGAGGAVTSISGVSTSYNDQGQTTTVTFQTNRGSVSIPGNEFKETFNLRAPGYLSIPQKSFAFFNIEHK